MGSAANFTTIIVKIVEGTEPLYFRGLTLEFYNGANGNDIRWGRSQYPWMRLLRQGQEVNIEHDDDERASRAGSNRRMPLARTAFFPSSCTVTSSIAPVVSTDTRVPSAGPSPLFSTNMAKPAPTASPLARRAFRSACRAPSSSTACWPARSMSGWQGPAKPD